ncbi:ATP-binding protein [Chloroflexi bacterium TSY]|nr:ATP-binding protein [Chloroflexi bacterium TSY]
MPKPIQASSYTFRDIIEGGFLYVDKTRYLYELIRYSKGLYFLARPRRFGKSLMISTLYEIFQGNRELFQGLWLDQSDYEWQSYPIIRIDFSQESIRSSEELKEVLRVFMDGIAAHHGIALSEAPYQRQFRWLIQRLAGDGKVVILIDEYDKPILDNIDTLSEAIRIRDVLRNFYGVIKAMDRHLRFVLLTGISKFSKVGVFSVMNNLDDLSMSPHFANALGITDDELVDYFQEHIAAFAVKTAMTEHEMLARIRHWYNGFRFVEHGDNVYNPFSTLQLFHHQRFANYWFATGTPTFLIKLIKDRNYDIEPFDELLVPELSFSTYEIESLELIPLLYQTGYLTIKDFRTNQFGEIYTLSYPNYEVKNAFLTYLLNAYNQIEVTLSDGYLRQLLYALQTEDLDQFFAILNVFFANIDYDLQIKQEKYYQTIFFIIFKLLGLRVDAEGKTNQGRIDAVIKFDDRLFLFEFKLNGNAGDALAQIRKTEYAEKYLRTGKPLILIGANFDSNNARKITAWESETV